MTVAVADLAHGDHVEIRFLDPVIEEDVGEIDRARGVILTVVGQVYVADELHKSGLGMPRMLRIDDATRIEIERVATAEEVRHRKRERARGELVFTTPPRDAFEIEAQLLTLAEMALAAPRGGIDARRDQLLHQFDDLADTIFLAKRKRTYLLKKAEIGRDFHPWLDPDPRIFRIETVRPLLCDFELERERRSDRVRRLEESVRIFGEAERETRLLSAALRRAGFDPRRPHPNAQSLLVPLQVTDKQSFDIALSVSQNGLWDVTLPHGSNKGQDRLRRRVLREGLFDEAKASILPLLER